MKIKMPVIISMIFVIGIFLFFQLAHSANTDIIINEIGAYEASNHEWVEIYNKGDAAVDISGWKFLVEGESKHGINLTSSTSSFVIEPGEYAIIAENDVNFLLDYPDCTGKVFDSSWGGINEDGAKKIGLEDADGTQMEYFNYSSAPNFSLERKDVNQPADEVNNWQENLDGNTVGRENYWKIGGTGDTEHGDGEDEDDEEDIDNEGGETTSSAPTALVINEFVSDPIEGQNEWVELYNAGTTTIDLDGWTLLDGTGVIASPTGTIDASSFFIIELSTSKLNNPGDTLVLKNSQGETIDTVSYGDWDDNNTGDNALAVDDPNSLARMVDGQDTNNDKNDWVETTTVTKGEVNIITAPVTAPSPSSGSGGGGNLSTSVSYDPGDVVINEINSDPADGAEEFIELYNKTNSNIILDNWWVEDGSEVRTRLVGRINSQGFFVVEKPSGNLNNAGDMVILFSPEGAEIDRLVFGEWDDGNINDNAPAPEDPCSLARRADGQDSNNDYYDFVLTSAVTKGSANKISAVTEDGEAVEQIMSSTKVVINEIFPNPVGSDNEEEFIELKNLGTETVNLKDWQLSDSGTRKYKITLGVIQPSGYIFFKRPMTGIALNNTGGDEIKLYSPNGNLLDKVKYSGSAEDNYSYVRLADGGWKWTSHLTAGQENIIEGKSAAPIVSIDTDSEVVVGESIVFDASDTTDPEGQQMSFAWNFGDGEDDTGDVVEHAFDKEGIYTVILQVTNKNGDKAEKRVIITVKNKSDFVGGYYEDDDLGKVGISEILPNPEGSDTTEFIELFNPTGNDIDLSGIKIDDEEGGSRAYTIPDNIIIPAGAYLVFGRQDTKLALNNTSDSVRLLYPDGTILKEVRFDEVLEGASYIQDENDNWLWTSAITPGEQNGISLVKEKITTRKISTKSKGIKPIIGTTLEKLRDEDVGDKVRVNGVVAVEPGVLGTQYFYIVDSAGSAQADSAGSSQVDSSSLVSSGQAGVQVYMFKKDFPDLKVGDRVEVTGEITESYGNTRIKLAGRDDIKKIDHPGDPLPVGVEVAEVGETLEGQLVQVQGEITEVKGSYMYVDDGSEEVQVYFKRGANINKKIFQVGDLVSVRGLVYQTKSGYQILPRFQEDIEKTGVAEEAVVQVEANKEENKKEVAEKYLTATAGGLTSILFGLFAKARGKLALSLIKKAGLVAVAIIKRNPRV